MCKSNNVQKAHCVEKDTVQKNNQICIKPYSAETTMYKKQTLCRRKTL